MVTKEPATTNVAPGRVVSLGITGMTCASCVAHVEHALRGVNGVSGAQVNLATEKAAVDLAQEVALDTLRLAVEDAGYGLRTEKTSLLLDGLSVPADSVPLTRALMSLPGVRWASVDIEANKATVEYLVGTAQISELRSAIESGGFAFLGVEEEEFDQHALTKAEEAHRLRRRFLVALPGALIVMTLGMGPMVPAFPEVPNALLNVTMFPYRHSHLVLGRLRFLHWRLGGATS